jgi:hypothetical protein
MSTNKSPWSMSPETMFEIQGLEISGIRTKVRSIRSSYVRLCPQIWVFTTGRRFKVQLRCDFSFIILCKIDWLDHIHVPLQIIARIQFLNLGSQEP